MMQLRPRKKQQTRHCIGCQTTTTRTTTTNNKKQQSIVVNNYKVLSELPLLVQWKILGDVVVLSSTAADADVDVEDVLTSLSRVCWLWHDIVTDAYFRKQLVRKLVARDPLFRHRRHSIGAHLLISATSGVQIFPLITILDDELFLSYFDGRSASSFFAVYDLGAVTRLMRAQPKRRQVDMRPHHRRDLPCPADVRRAVIVPYFVVCLYACELNRSMYVSEGRTPANPQTPTAWDIYRIAVDDGRVLARWTTDDNPGSGDLYVCRQTGRVLVPDYLNGRIVEYDSDGQRTRTVDVRAVVADTWSGLYMFAVVARSLTELTVTYSNLAAGLFPSPVVICAINVPTANGSYVYDSAPKCVHNFTTTRRYSLTDDGLCAVLFNGRTDRFRKSSIRNLTKYDVEFLGGPASNATSSSSSSGLVRRRRVSLLSTRNKPAGELDKVHYDTERGRIIAVRNNRFILFDLLCEELR